MGKEDKKNEVQMLDLEKHIQELNIIYKENHKLRIRKGYTEYIKKIREKLSSIEDYEKKDLLKIYEIKAGQDSAINISSLGVSVAAVLLSVFPFMKDLSAMKTITWSENIWCILISILLLAIVILLLENIRSNYKKVFNQLVVSVLKEELNK